MVENWKIYKLEELSKRVCVGFVGTCHKFYTENGVGVPMIRTTNLSKRGLDLNGVQYVEMDFHLKQKKSQLKKGDILIARHGTNGQACLYELEEEANCLNVVIVRPDQKLTDYKWLLYAINSPLFRNQVNSHSTGSVQKVVNTRALASFELNSPSLQEQRAIASILSALDDKIELNLQMNKTLEAMAMALYKHWFVDFGPFQDGEFVESELGEIPRGWEVKRLDEIFKIKIGRTPPRKEPKWFSKTSGIKWVSIKDMGNAGAFIFNSSEYLTHDAVDKKNVPIVPNNSVILSFKLTVGRVSITTEDMVTNEAIAHFKIGKENLSSEHLYLALKVFDYDSLGSTSSIATAVNSKTVKSMKVILPDELTRKAFQEEISLLFEMIKNTSFENQTLTKLRDTLLPKLISGEVRVKEALEIVEKVM